MRPILLSAYRCSPDGVSEAYSGFRCAVALAEERPVVLCTPSYNEPSIRRWLASEASDVTKGNLSVLAVNMWDIDSKVGAAGAALKPGFFVYESLLMPRLRRLPTLGDCCLVWHRTPVSFRFRTRLHSLGLPLVVGPISGGLAPPAALADYFRSEGALYKLRRFDRVLIESRFWMRPLDKAAVVLISSDYVRELLPARLSPRLRTLVETGTELRPPRGRRVDASAPFQVLFVGRLVRYKCPILAVEAFARFL
jgi:glycosyltransferase involved in cell wall biosynthesis